MIRNNEYNNNSEKDNVMMEIAAAVPTENEVLTTNDGNVTDVAHHQPAAPSRSATTCYYEEDRSDANESARTNGDDDDDMSEVRDDTIPSHVITDTTEEQHNREEKELEELKQLNLYKEQKQKQQEHDDRILASLLANGMTTYEVIIPKGYKSGDIIPVYAGRERVLVKCPIGTSGGSRIRFELISTKLFENQQLQLYSAKNPVVVAAVGSDDEKEDDDNNNNNNVIDYDNISDYSGSNHTTMKSSMQVELVENDSSEDDNNTTVTLETAQTFEEGRNPKETIEIIDNNTRDQPHLNNNSCTVVPTSISNEEERKKLQEESDYKVACRLQELDEIKQIKGDGKVANLIGSGLRLSVQVPDHIQPGEQFIVMAIGVPILVTCPNDAKPGQYIKVIYDKNDTITTTKKKNKKKRKEDRNNSSRRSHGNNNNNNNWRRRTNNNNEKTTKYKKTNIVPLSSSPHPTIAKIPNESKKYVEKEEEEETKEATGDNKLKQVFTRRFGLMKLIVHSN